LVWIKVRSAIGLGIHVYGFDPSLTVERAWQLSSSVIDAASIEDLLTRADLITLHIPLDERTRHFIDGSRLALMKQGAILINLSRSGVVDEAALCAALGSGKLRGYVTDFAIRATLDQPRAIVRPIMGLRPPRLRSTVRPWWHSPLLISSRTARFAIR
jgi:D-3-phosphoglycerate dehydrogenase / 2-oxoglutarate reductase